MSGARRAGALLLTNDEWRALFGVDPSTPAT
jgi:hypothetical protein